MDVKSEMENGGSLVENAGNSGPYLTITNVLTELVPGASRVSEKTWLKMRGNAVSPAGHPTVKAVELMRYLCKMITPPGGVVLDPFMGSGSTALAAYAEDFNFIGIELEQEYFEIAEARIKAATSQQKMF